MHLDRHRAVGRNDVEIARARNARAAADVAGLAPRLDECRLIAPFDGRIVELSLRAHERTVPQKPFLAIIDDRRLEIELIAPSTMLASLAAGRRFAFLVDELDGRAVPATVARIGAVVDPVSKTVKIMGALAGPAEGLLAGMSGTARFEAVRP